MAKHIYINGEYFAEADAKISVFDHGLLYGDGVFEGLRTYSGKVFRLEDHVKRLYESAKAIWLEIPMTQDEFAEAINQAVAKNELSDGYVRAIVTRGAGSLGLDPRRCTPQVIIIADSIKLYPQEYYDNGLEIITVSVIRNHPAALSPRIKSLNYLNNILAKIEGIQCGCIEALMLNHNGEVAECTGDNVFVVKNSNVLTPPLDAGILAGITRQAVIDLCIELTIPVAETVLTKHDVYVSDECFLTGSAAEVIPVVKVDSRTIGSGKPGPITKRLTDAFHELVRR